MFVSVLGSKSFPKADALPGCATPRIDGPQIHEAEPRHKLAGKIGQPDAIAGRDGKPLRGPGEKLEHGAHRAAR